MENGTPIFLERLLNTEYDSDTVKKIFEGYKKKRHTTFRVNTNKTTIQSVQEKLIKVRN